MPRIRQKTDEYAMNDFVSEINAQCARYGYKTQQAFGELLGVSQPTAGKYLQNPDCIQLCMLRKMVLKLHLDPMVVLMVLGYSTREIKNYFERWK